MVFMNYLIRLFLLISFLSLFIASPSVYAQKNDVEIDAILNAAESFFKFIKQRDYVKTWNTLTRKSQDTIVDDVFKEIEKMRSSQKDVKDYSKEEIFADFAAGGPLSKSYWDNFLEYVNPDIVLEKSRWDIGTIKGNKANISVKYKKSDNPAILQLYKENSAWKFGLVETFWTRK
jgi:hypothetical protein